MLKIDKEVIRYIKRNETIFKKNKLKDNNILKKEFYASLKNYEEKFDNKSCFETALWIDSNEKNIVSASNTKKYALGEIILVDLGLDNYSKEFAFVHPAIVVDNKYNKVFIVPCSSQTPKKDKNGKIYPEYVVGTVNDGFIKDSVIMLEDARYIDKSRIISTLGKVTPDFFDKVYNKLFSHIFEPKYYELEKYKNK